MIKISHHELLMISFMLYPVSKTSSIRFKINIKSSKYLIIEYAFYKGFIVSAFCDYLRAPH